MKKLLPSFNLTNNFQPMNQTATILIVDDNAANLGVLSDALDQAGYEVWVAKSGKVALERVKFARPDLILLDVMMPEIDGFETCRQLQANPATCNIPIIFMTALSDTANKIEGFSLGAVDYITKPFQQEEVMARVKLHLKLHELTGKLEEKNAQLEQKVAEVSQAYQDLQRMQLKLIQSEKLSSLGQIVTGIAHEIHNPVNFIYGNLTHADKYIQDLLGLLSLYREDFPDATPRIQAQLEAVELDFLEEDLIKLLNSMNLGAQRIHEIVKFMRIFSRVDEAEFKPVNIHEGIDSTLTILNYRLKAKLERPEIGVVRNYGKLPAVECYAGQLNQALMSILSYTIDTLKEFNKQRSLEEIKNHPNQIQISTQVIDENWIQISIASGGLEICKEKAFNRVSPDAMTQAISKETGLGLSISYQIIVEKHGGKLYCQSAPGQGTAFIIEIPVKSKGTQDGR